MPIHAQIDSFLFPHFIILLSLFQAKQGLYFIENKYITMKRKKNTVSISFIPTETKDAVQIKKNCRK